MNVAERKSHGTSHGWEPISTAPKDKFVLLACPSGYTTTPWVFTTGILHSDYKVGRWVDHANDDLSDWGMSPMFWRGDIITPDSTTAAIAPAVPQGEPVACLVRQRTLRTRAAIAHDGQGHFSEWSDWYPATLKYGTAVTDPRRNSGPEHLFEMLPLVLATPAPAPAVRQGWISVADRLPDGEPGDPAIEFYNNDLRNPTRQVIGIYREGVWHSGGHQFCNVTYWKPLTPAPVCEAGGEA